MHKKKILIADDELYIRSLLKSALATECVVLEASDGEQAVNITRAEKPDLILMDILMPGTDGYTALHEIKQDNATSTIPVVMLTGMSFKPHKRLAKKLGADGYITKPFDLEDLTDKVRRYESMTVKMPADPGSD